MGRKKTAFEKYEEKVQQEIAATQCALEKAVDEALGEEQEAEAEEEVVKVTRTQVVRRTRRTLTPEERIGKGLEMVRQMEAWDSLDRDLKATTKEMKGQMERVKAEICILGDAVRDGAAYEETACEQVMDYEHGRVLVTAFETGEVVEDRAMRDDERQMEL